MKSNKQTAVEWLMEQITFDNGFGQRHNSFIDSFDLSEFFEKAKELEKQQANSEEDLLNNLIKLNKTAIDENWKMSEVGEQFFKIFAYN